MKSEVVRHSGHERMTLLSKFLACLHVLRQPRQKQWLQLGMMPNLKS